MQVSDNIALMLPIPLTSSSSVLSGAANGGQQVSGSYTAKILGEFAIIGF